MKHPKQLVAAARRDVDPVVHGHVEASRGDQSRPQNQQAGGKPDNQRNNDQTSEKHLCHCAAAICVKDAKPSDMSPARMKAIPRPRSPSGRSA